jgi:imidazolonepropionase-like amidohydrolase
MIDRRVSGAPIFAVLLLSLVLLVSPLEARVASNGVIVIRNVTIVDVQGNKLVANRDVIVRGDRIAGVQSGGTAQPPKDARVVDGTGKFLMPGLWDFHVHVFSAAGEQDLALPMYIVNGVTGIRDAGAIHKLPKMQAVVNAIERGERVGPRIVLAGAMIDGPPGSWPGQMVASNAGEGRARVRESKTAGWAFVKSYSLLGEAAYLAIASEAKRQRLPLYGHVPESVRLQTAIDAGHRSVEHFGRITQACSTAEAEMISANSDALRSGNPMAALMTVMAGHNKTTLEHWDEKLCLRVAEQLANARVAVMPSLMVSDFYVGKDPAPDDPRMQSVPKAVRVQWGQGDWRRQQMSQELLALAPKSIALDWKTFKLAHDAGVTMLAGTDAAYANPFIFHGYTLHDELERYVAAGLTPQQALMTATVNPGRFLKRDDLDGRVSSGQLADLVLLDANPLDDVRATRRINAVIANGRLFDRHALDKLLRDVESKAARE